MFSLSFRRQKGAAIICRLSSTVLSYPILSCPVLSSPISFRSLSFSPVSSLLALPCPVFNWIVLSSAPTYTYIHTHICVCLHLKCILVSGVGFECVCVCGCFSCCVLMLMLAIVVLLLAARMVFIHSSMVLHFYHHLCTMYIDSTNWINYIHMYLNR